MKNILFVTAIISLSFFRLTAAKPVKAAFATGKSLATFYVLTIEDDLRVVLVEGNEPSIRVEGDSKAIQSVKIRQNGDHLVIGKKNFSSTQPVVYVTTDKLRILEVTGDASVHSEGTLSGDLLWVKLAGNGNVQLQTNALKVLTTSWAKGKISIRGSYPLSATYRTETGKLVTSYRKNADTMQEETGN